MASDSPDLVIPQPGALDDTSTVHAEAHIGTRSAQAWLSSDPAVPSYRTQAEDMMDLLTAATAYRPTLPPA